MLGVAVPTDAHGGDLVGTYDLLIATVLGNDAFDGGSNSTQILLQRRLVPASPHFAEECVVPSDVVVHVGNKAALDVLDALNHLSSLALDGRGHNLDLGEVISIKVGIVDDATNVVLVLRDGDNDDLAGVVVEPASKAASQERIHSAYEHTDLVCIDILITSPIEGPVGSEGASEESLLGLAPGPKTNITVSYVYVRRDSRERMET